MTKAILWVRAHRSDLVGGAVIAVFMAVTFLS